MTGDASSWRIRPATASDIPALVALRRAMFEDMGHRDAAALDAMACASTSYFLRTLPAGEFLAWLAEADGEVIASGGCTIHSSPPGVANLAGREGYIMSMYTRPEWRGRGIATAILQAILDHLRVHGICMATLRASPAGRPIYEHLGFAASPEMRLTL